MSEAGPGGRLSVELSLAAAPAGAIAQPTKSNGPDRGRMPRRTRYGRSGRYPSEFPDIAAKRARSAAAGQGMRAERYPPARSGKVTDDAGSVRVRGSAAADRSVRARDHLSARVGDRPLRLPLRLLHVREHELPAEGRSAHARGTRPAVQRLRRARRAQAAADRRRAAGAARHHDALRLAVAPSGVGRARRADADHQRLAASEIRARARRSRRQAHQRFARHARSRRNSAPSRAGASSTR